MLIERKTYSAKSDIQDEAEGKVHVIVSVFENKDSDNDIIHKGAFADSIKTAKELGKFPPGIWSHDWKSPVARTDDAYEDSEGLNVLAQFNMKTQRGRETFYDIEQKIITEYSFGFTNTVFSRKDDVRHITNLKWMEWSPVLIGANRQTRTESVKEAKSDILGSYAESRATMAAIGTLMDGLCYDVFYSALYDDETPLDDRVKWVQGAIEEFSSLTTRIMTALLSDKGDETSKEAAQAARALFVDPAVKNSGLLEGRSGMTFRSHLGAVLDIVSKGMERTRDLVETKQRDGNNIPLPIRDSLGELEEKLDSTLKGVKALRSDCIPRASEDDIRRLLSSVAVLDTQLGQAGIPLS